MPRLRAEECGRVANYALPLGGGSQSRPNQRNSISMLVFEAVFQAVLTAATQDGDMAAAKLIIDRVIPSRRGAPVSFHIRPLKTPEDCALAYADLLDDVGAGRLTPEEAQTISAIVAKRAELFASVELATEIEALKAQLAAVVGAQRPPIADPPPVRDHLTIASIMAAGRRAAGAVRRQTRLRVGERSIACPRQ